jgi:hypothetical protein
MDSCELPPGETRFRKENNVPNFRSSSIVPVGVLLLCLLCVASVPPAAFSHPDSAPSAPAAAEEPAAPSSLLLIENLGQYDDRARFFLHGGSAPLWLTDDALWVTLVGERPATGTELRGPETGPGSRGLEAVRPARPGVHLRLSFAGANPRAHLEPFGRQETVINSYRGDDPTRWRANVPVWGGARYVDLYPGIDLEIIGRGSQWTWQFVCRGDCSSLQDVRLQVEGAESLTVSDAHVRVLTAVGVMELPLLTFEGATTKDQPAVQRAQGGIIEVYAPFAAQTAVETPQDSPERLLYSTFLGGGDHDAVWDAAVGPGGHVHLTGYTSSAAFPTTPGAYDPSLAADVDAFVAVLDPAGNGPADLLYSTFIGGSYSNETWGSAELGRSIAVDASGNTYVAGTTRSANFPTTENAFDRSFNGDLHCPDYSPDVACMDIVLFVLDPSGALSYSTYIGGRSTPLPGGSAFGGDDVAKGLALREGIVYIAGYTRSGDFPTTPGAFSRQFSDFDIALTDDAFVVKLNPAGNGAADLLYGTYVGSAFAEKATDLDVDSAGVVHVTGHSQGSSFPKESVFPTTPGAYDEGPLPPGGQKSFYFKLDPAGNGPADLLYSTFLGGDSDREWGGGVSVNAAGDTAYLIGRTGSRDFPVTPGAFDTVCGTDGTCNYLPLWGSAGDAFVAVMTPQGNGPADLLYATFLGGSYVENFNTGGDIVVNGAGRICVTGETWSPEGFPTTPNAFDSSFNGTPDAFVTCLNPQGAGASDLLFSTVFGAVWGDYGTSIKLGERETVLLTGYSESSSLPTTPTSYDPSWNGGYDGFVAQLDVGLEYAVWGQARDGNGMPLPGIRISAGGTLNATTDLNGNYSLFVRAGAYRLAPTTAGYFWSPADRQVVVPPEAADQDFIGRNIIKHGLPPASERRGYGDTITYTVHLVHPDGTGLAFYDGIPNHTSYVDGSLVGPPGVVYDAAKEAISGPSGLVAGVPATVSFAVRVDITGTAETAPLIQNRACLRPEGSGLDECIWSNLVTNYTYVWPVYLPLVIRAH